ncbi:MAG TPA: recombinase family protein [Candidatus Bathyarchaeia archaeon]|nr:recombinase family protein [Candidatus Bathyarchaeia archaeon]
MNPSTQPMPSKKCLIYTRVSTDEQVREGMSLDVQKRVCSKWAKDNGYQIVGIYTDEGKSATTTKGRHGLEDLIIHCQKEHIDIVLVLDTDRLARNPFSHYSIKEELRKVHTEIISVSQPMIDNSPEGNLVDGIMANVNAFQSQLTGRKVRKSLEKKCQDGWWPGWAKLGYLNHNKGTADNPEKIIIVDPERSPLITLFFKLYSTGNFSIDSLVDLMYEKGLRSKNGKKVSRSILYNVLHDPFYFGKIEFKSRTYQGKHPHLTTSAIFKTCQRISSLHNQNACRRRKYRWLLNGFAYCSVCRKRIYAEWHKPKVKAYYHCSKRNGDCRQPYIEMNHLEKKIELEFKKLQLSQEFSQRIVDKAKELVKKSRENIEEDKQALRNAINQLEIKRNRLEDELLDRTISKEAFKRKHTELEGQIKSLQEQIHDIETNQRIDIDVISRVMDMASNIYETYKKSNFDAKRIYLGIFFEKFEIKNKKVAKAIPTPLFASLIEHGYCRVTPNWLPGLDSNQ